MPSATDCAKDTENPRTSNARARRCSNALSFSTIKRDLSLGTAAYLGIDAEPADGGMQATKVFPLTGAEAAGLRVGDVVLRVNGVATPDAAALGSVIRRSAVGSRLALEVRRSGEVLSLAGTLGRRPEEDEDEAEQFPTLLGLEAALPAPFDADFGRFGVRWIRPGE